MPAIAWSDLDAHLWPLPAWRFYCTLPSGISGAASTSPDGSLIGAQIISFFVERVSCPLGTIEVETVPFQAGARNFATGRSIEQLTLTLMENYDLSVIQYLTAWQSLVVDPSGNFGLPASYWQTIYVQPYDLAGGTNGTLVWTSAFPTHIQGFDLDGTATAHVSPTVTFAVNTDDSYLDTGSSGFSNGIFSPINPYSPFGGALGAVDAGIVIGSEFIG